MKRSFGWILLVAVGFVFLRSGDAQTDEQKAEVLKIAGEEAGNALLSVYGAVNTLASNRNNGVFSEAEVLELATSYRGSAELTLRLLRERGNTPELLRLIDGADLLVKQATALEAWIRIGDDALAPTYKKLEGETTALLFGGTDASGGSPEAPSQEVIRYRTTKAVGLDGETAYSAVMTVSRTSPTQALQVHWDYDDGSSESGIGVTFPKSGMLAVGFGTGVSSVGLYKRDGKTAEGVRVSGGEGSKISSVRLTQGESASVYEMEGGGRFFFSKGGSNTGIVRWEADGETLNGIAVGAGDYIAVVSCSLDARAGVAIYSMSPDGKTAESIWTINGSGRSARENLVLDDVLVAGHPAEGGVSVEGEVKTIAKELLGGLPLAAKYQPDASQIEAISATPADAAKLTGYVTSIYAELSAAGSPAKEGQTEILVGGPGLKDLPGGYTTHSKHFNPGVEIYSFKYVEPGKTLGMSYDGLMNVDGDWIFIPKAWRAFAE